MALYLVLLSTILAFSLTSTEQYISSPGSILNLSLDTMKNASGHLITRLTLDGTQRRRTHSHYQRMSTKKQATTLSSLSQWILQLQHYTVDTGRYTKKENPQPLPENVYQETSNDPEQFVSVDFATPALHDTSMSGAVQPTAASTSTAITTNTTTTTTTTPKSCPQSGYQLYPEFNCYKAFNKESEEKSWSEARQQCISDGGDLMVMDSERELEDVYIPLYNSMDFFYLPWVGVYIPEGGNDWTTVKGQPAPSTWWEPDYPANDSTRNCALAFPTGLLVNGHCIVTSTFICEISL